MTINQGLTNTGNISATGVPKFYFPKRKKKEEEEQPVKYRL